MTIRTRVLPALVLLISSGVFSLAWAAHPPHPPRPDHPTRPQSLDGLKAAAKVVRDVDGIAHVQARNEHDLFFLQGYIHAQDRLFQMDVSRRTDDGPLAEFLGPGALANDEIGRAECRERGCQSV